MKDSYVRKAFCINVVDGDTIDCTVDLGYHMTTLQRFRLVDINTPERRMSGWAEATNFTRERVLGKEIYIQSSKSDSFGRYLADVYYPIKDGDNNITYMNLNDELLQTNHAVLFKR